MKCAYLIGALAFVWVCESRHLTGCRDKHVWIADGSVDCKYLYTASKYGLHTKAEYYCTRYPQTYCCDTCTDLGFIKGKKSNATQTPVSVTTPGAESGTTPGTTSVPTLGTIKPPQGCQDTYVMIADGSVECKYLYTPSTYGLHSKTGYYCTNHPLTYCCHTCTRLGFGKRPGALQTSTDSTTTKPGTVKTSTRHGLPVTKARNKFIDVTIKTLDTFKLRS